MTCVLILILKISLREREKRIFLTQNNLRMSHPLILKSSRNAEISLTNHILPRCFQVTSEAVVRRCSVKKVFLEISQNSEENACARVSFLINLQA